MRGCGVFGPPCRLTADDSNPANLTNHPAGDFAPAWSPHGDQIAFLSNRDGNFEVYVMDTDGSNQTNVSQNPAFDGDEGWSPDASRLVFFSERDGDADIWVMDADGSNPAKLTHNGVVDAFPDWSPDGARSRSRAIGEGVPTSGS